MRLTYYAVVVVLIAVFFWNGGALNLALAWAVGLGAEPMLRRIEREVYNRELERLAERLMTPITAARARRDNQQSGHGD